MPSSGRVVLSGDSPLVGAIRDAAAEFDLPAELLAAVGWAETRLIDRAPSTRDHHVPGAIGVMGVPERGRVRSVGRAAGLLGIEPTLMHSDMRTNVRGAAAMLRDLAPAGLSATGHRDAWLDVVAEYFDAGDVGALLALDVRQVIVRGVETTDANGRRFVIHAYPEKYGPPVASVKQSALSAEYPAATWAPADPSNYTRAGRSDAQIDSVVIHTAQGSYGGTISWFRNPAANVSAHYVVRRSDGAVTQMVHDADVGWHAGLGNQTSIGIELEGFVDRPDNYTDAMLEQSARLTRWLCDTHGIPKTRANIIAHSEVPGATHTDPGQYFPWARFMGLVVNGPGTPPPGDAGTLQGVVHVGTDTSDRVAGARVTITPGGQVAIARAGDAFWSFRLPPGAYTITAEADGFMTASLTRTVSANATVWGSIGLAPVEGGRTGTLRGVVYDATRADAQTPVAGARVTVSDGSTQVVGADGAFDFTLAPATYTLIAEKTGWQTGSASRTVTAGGVELSSIGLTPTAMDNSRPHTPVPASPTSGVEVRYISPVFTVEGLSDAEGDALTIDIEIYADGDLTTRVSAGRLAAPSGVEVVSWNHPRDDLPRGAILHWRARAIDANGASPWSRSATFRTPSAPGTPVNGDAVFEAVVLAGVGLNAAPGAAVIQSPADGATVDSVRPQLKASAATDADGDVLRYQFQIATDDLFSASGVQSPLVPDEGAGPSWVVTAPLTPLSSYYARVRAADDRVFGPWSTARMFRVSADARAAKTDNPRPDVRTDSGGGCATSSGEPSSMAVWLVAFVAVSQLRRRR